MAVHIDQVANLARALKTVLEVQNNEPLEGDQVGALATAIERAVEDAASLFDAYYHPDSLSSARDRKVEATLRAAS